MATFRARATIVILSLCLLILHNTDAYQVAIGSSPVPAPAPPKAPAPAPPNTPAPSPPKAPAPAPPKTPAPAPPQAPAPAPKIDCTAACAYRCSKTKRPNLCKRTCGGCCSICNCVPPGTYGNYEACPCYYKLTTRKKNNQVVRKCP